ncbi:pyridoxal phosphate-dependent decarboxylase family protein [Naasia aerilata]|uniref:Aspartate aminotransferase family protein n=1 Tax=Naasia aerilata TaxID=1162966 RepID=A0ABM8GGV1_9MICO|nr:aminotransferase class V-fold PLP-dependent enzyme [Naasia aerilata]BDZ47566.1 aspartate aminotransferase family protein [Naasia aerilata]
MDADDAVLDSAAAHARRWLSGLDERRIPAAGTAEDAAARLGTELPERGSPAAQVLERLVAAVEPGLMASASGRFYGWVMGSTLPAAIAADWLVSAWDQNAGMRDATPGVVAAEEVAASWLVRLLRFPDEPAVGFTTGATTANFACLAAARGRVLARAGWDLNEGLFGAPRIRVLVGAERHSSVDLALRYLGLGVAEAVGVDAQGRLDAAQLREALVGWHGPTIVCLQAGNIHSGAFDPFEEAIDAAHRVGAWVHVDGAFGLWAAATPTLRHLVAGLDEADSWATDAHKTLNTPYDCGIALVEDGDALRAAMGVHASYLLTSASSVDPFEQVPEMSRRARGVPVWVALATLGAEGVRGLVEGLVESAQALAEGLRRIPGVRVLNDVVYTQVSVAFESDERTREVYRRLVTEGTVMPSASVWHDEAVIRFSVSSWRTGSAEVAETLAAVERAALVGVAVR